MTTEARSPHLNDREFGDLLAGKFPGAAAEMHVGTCEHCRRELGLVQDSLDSFLGLGGAWAQAVAPVRVAVPSRLALRLGAWPSWSMGLAATTVAGVLAVGLGLSGPHTSSVPVAGQASAAPSTTELADDNRLMLSINQELSSQTQPAVPVSQLRVEARDTEHRAGDAVLD